MKILFLHIPKTAGTSIECVLRDKYNYPEWLMKPHKLSTSLNRCDYYNYIPDYSFTVVRNPYDRLISMFFFTREQYILNYKRITKNYNINVENVRLDDYNKYTTLEFNDWIKYIFFERIDDKLLSIRLVPLGITHTQSSHIDCDYDIDIFKLEELHKLEEKLNIQIPKLNASVKKPIIWTEESKKIIQKVWREDFERFDYPI